MCHDHISDLFNPYFWLKFTFTVKRHFCLSVARLPFNCVLKRLAITTDLSWIFAENTGRRRTPGPLIHRIKCSAPSNVVVRYPFHTKTVDGRSAKIAFTIWLLTFTNVLLSSVYLFFLSLRIHMSLTISLSFYLFLLSLLLLHQLH